MHVYTVYTYSPYYMYVTTGRTVGPFVQFTHTHELFIFVYFVEGEQRQTKKRQPRVAFRVDLTATFKEDLFRKGRVSFSLLLS